ncbi:MAG: prolipoprotein diacylglyceryl transferase [Bacteroidetes bacterium]|nr:prolipoprotein diacylglyceryl transferase [Bacteroidota bacterium]
MFPDFRYLVFGLTGYFPPDWVGLFKTFGALVAIAFLAATAVMIRELKRKEQDGLIGPSRNKKTGQKLWPHQRISEIVMIAAVGGLVGAKIFNALETWQDFLNDPIGSLFSRSGLTFYGGLIVATAIFYYFARKNGIRFAHLCDAAAPAILLAYGIGRIGCQLAGDGDWGIYNSAYVTTADGSLREVPKTAGEEAIAFYHKSQRIDTTHRYTPAGILPRWLVAQNYPRNVGNEGLRLADCPNPDYCAVLPIAVFPTPIYEAIACVALFFFLWSIRRKLKRPWQMFGLYLLVAGMERFLVELIRVNYKYDWGFIHPTQAEIISVCLVLLGSFLLLRRGKELPRTSGT